MDYLQKSFSLSPCSSFSFSSSSSSFSSSSFDGYPFSIDPELWQVAEERIQEILWIIQPTLASEQKRKEVIDYIRVLIKACYSTEVLPFGSVPLKTYLPDGDIDLTAISQPKKEDEFAREVCKVLEYKEQQTNSEVRDVRYIEAQVKVVKCCVKDISIDISFNQIPGLSTLCFLEKVDQLIGRNHLLKNSILLIKAWCFYESRILGAYHGLISTYALEILVVHVINVFHLSLPSPLAVLLKFLDYYSTFEWDKYCVGINGPIALSSFPGIAAESLENTTGESLLTPEFLRSCREQFSVPVKPVENGGQEFCLKHLNILDPLKYDNNLGRSVSKGSFNRIKCAFTFGAQRLQEIFKYPEHNMGAKLEEFFKNTLERNGKGERPDAMVAVPAFGTGKSQGTDLTGDYENHYNSLVQSQWYINICSPPLSPQFSPPLSPSELPVFLSFNHNTYPQRNGNAYFPTLRPYYPCASQPFAGSAGIDQLGKSRGTGTYIPNVRSSTYRDFARQRSPGPNCYGPPQRKEVEVEKKVVEKKENGCHDLSLDQFPLLPTHKNPMLSENNEPDFKSLQAKECSPSLGGMEFGTYKSVAVAEEEYGITPPSSKMEILNHEE